MKDNTYNFLQGIMIATCIIVLLFACAKVTKEATDTYLDVPRYRIDSIKTTK